eukprot:7943706-Pyramimonas_sp.AAC.1
MPAASRCRRKASASSTSTTTPREDRCAQSNRLCSSGTACVSGCVEPGSCVRWNESGLRGGGSLVR